MILLLATTAAQAQEWTQWRGPARDGSVSAKNAPTQWPEATWRVEIGEGYSSPVVTGGRYDVAESSTFATPVLLGSNILVRDATGLTMLTTTK